MPVHKEINHDFFKNWSPEMAYILGFFAADGTMIKNRRGAHFIELEITDFDYPRFLIAIFPILCVVISTVMVMLRLVILKNRIEKINHLIFKAVSFQEVMPSWKA
jgi:hypothetical protein